MVRTQGEKRKRRIERARIALCQKLELDLLSRRETRKPVVEERIPQPITSTQSTEASTPPIYRLVIPANQLAILNQFDPELNVIRIFGTGSFSGSSSEESFEFGKIIAKPVGNVVLEYDYARGVKPLRKIFECCQSRNIPNVALTYLEYQDLVEVETSNPLYVALKFEKETILPKKYQALVVDGRFPKQEMYEILREIKRRLGELPREVVRSWKPSCLVLTDIAPDPKLLQDGPLIWALKRDYMLFVRETAKRWELYDYESKPRGGP